MSGVPYIFGTATTSIPLSQLDTDFATPVTIGSTAVALGNTTTTLAGLTGVTSSAITDSGLTSGRVTYSGTGGLLQDSANLTFNGTTLTAAGFSGPISGVVTSTSITDSGLTSGRVTYAGTGGLLQDSANLTFNGTTLTSVNFAPTGVVQFSTNAAQAAGSIAKNATYGLTYYGITGSSYDATLLNNAGNVALGVTTGTQNLVTGGNLAVTGTLSATGDLSAVNDLTLTNSAASYGNSNNFILFKNSSSATVGGITHPAVTTLGLWGNTGVKIFNGSSAATTIADFTSTGLAVTGTLSTTGDITLNGTNRVITAPGDASTSSGSIKFVTPFYAADTGASFGANGGTARILYTGGLGFYYGATLSSVTQAMILDNSGRLGIGTSSPTSTLSVTGTMSVTGSPQVGTTAASGEFMLYGNTTANSLSFRVQTATGSGNGPYHTFKRGTVDAGYVGSDAALNSSGDNNDIALMSTGDLYLSAKSGGGSYVKSAKVTSTGLAVTGTIIASTSVGVGNTTPSGGGAGIAFPATQSASTDANTLDDYEEGTWTPNQGSGLTVVGTFSSAGNYVKVGKMVTVQVSLTATTSITISSGDAVMFTNLPFASSPTRNPGVAVNIAHSAGLFVNAASTTVYSCGTLVASATIYVSITYQTS